MSLAFSLDRSSLVSSSLAFKMGAEKRQIEKEKEDLRKSKSQ